MFIATANLNLIAQTAVQRALAVRTDVQAAQNFYTWLSAQADADLTAVGFAAGDISFMRSMAADLNAFGNVYNGLAPGGAYVLPYRFATSSAQIIGSQ